LYYMVTVEEQMAYASIPFMIPPVDAEQNNTDGWIRLFGNIVREAHRTEIP
jgi:hypothetical protein